MVTFTLTFSPILEVLKNGGSIRLKDLVGKLSGGNPNTFREVRNTEHAIDTYSACLVIEGGIVKFNRKAKKYAKHGVMERDVQYALHESVENMGEYELYPLKTRENSDRCYLGILWGDIPEEPDEKKYEMNYPPGCDFRDDGSDRCTVGCGVSDDILERYNLISLTTRD